ncbi:MAG: endonuclease MutS2 [Firmicutes bacterium]|nr:endonuclease MutS2 [Bacillota bacterium]
MKQVLTEREIKNLGFQEIRRLLASLTVTPMARRKAFKLMPSADYHGVSQDLAQTSEARLLAGRSDFSPPAVVDIHGYLERVEKGGQLNGLELAGIADFLKGVNRWRHLFKNPSHREDYPALAGWVDELDPLRDLARSLEQSLDAEGRVLDSASSELQSLRRRRGAAEERIRQRLESYLRSPAWNRYLQESLVTIRGGRYVLPVKQEYQGRIPGVVHDQSSSGATFFIEPLPVVELQNQLAAFVHQEEEEIKRILRGLTARVAGQAVALGRNRELYGELDLIMARGRLSLHQSAVKPELVPGNKHDQFILVEARHPLIEGEVVPLTVNLGDPTRSLVITGPNTGGKTVALKTMGLLAAMLQSGLHIPASRGSRLPVFSSIRTDIGDEQDIVQSLSTFSGHLKNIIAIMDDADSQTLVLLDELGAGTDPSEGAALAKAVLASLAASGALTVATTHINELKIFAHQQEGMENASMEFDQETLAPTYRLLQGVPGQSNALVIAERLGLPPAIMEEARGFLRRDHSELELVIAGLVKDQRQLSQDSRIASQERARVALLRQQLEREREELRSQRREIIRQAREEARGVIRRTRMITENLIRDLHRLRDEGKAGSLPLAAEQVRKELKELQREVAREEPGPDEPRLKKEELAVGRKVKVISLQQVGEIISLSGQEAVIQVGKMKVHVTLSDLGRAGEEKEPAGEETGPGYTVQKSGIVRTQVDLRGMRLEEALMKVEKALDDALWAGLRRIDLIHGMGTGRLRRGLRRYLSAHRLVGKYRPGTRPEGGDGVTIVSLETGPIN